MRKRSVGIEAAVLHLVDGVHTVGEYLFFDVLEVVAGNDGLELHAEFVGQLASFGEQFEAHVCYAAVFILAIYYYVVFF